MACSCSSSLAGASASCRTSSSLSVRASPSSSSSSAPASVSLYHPYRQSHGVSSTVQPGVLCWDSNKSTQTKIYSAVTARQQIDTTKKNVSQRGGRDGRNASLAVKEDKVGKGNTDGGRHSNAYQYNSNRHSSGSKSRYQSKWSSNSRGNRPPLVDEDEDEDEGDKGDKPIDRIARSYARKLSIFSEEEEEDESEDDLDFDEDGESAVGGEDSIKHLIMPIPPAGFVLADDGSVSVMAPPHKRITILIDPQTKLPLECLIRRVFSSSDGRRCFLLCPLDTPVQILRIGEREILKELSDEELEDIFPTASFELAKQRLHLVQSGLCLTLRGGFCFSEADVIDLSTVYNESNDTLLSEGVEVANFAVNDSQYLIFTPLDPLMFVAYEDTKTGELLVADDDLMEDEPVLDAIDDEKEFQAYMEEDAIVDASSDEEDL